MAKRMATQLLRNTSFITKSFDVKIVFRFRTKHTNQISGKDLSWRRHFNVRHFVYEIQSQQYHQNFANYCSSNSQSERRIARQMPRSFPAPTIISINAEHYFFFNSSSTANCKAGSYSPTGLEPCFPCQKGDYQPLEGQSSCFKCNANTTTSRDGSNSSGQCESKSLNNNYV